LAIPVSARVKHRANPLPTTSASAYCCGNFERRKFKTNSVDNARLAKCAALFFDTDDGRHSPELTLQFELLFS